MQAPTVQAHNRSRRRRRRNRFVVCMRTVLGEAHHGVAHARVVVRSAERTKDRRDPVGRSLDSELSGDQRSGKRDVAL